MEKQFSSKRKRRMASWEPNGIWLITTSIADMKVAVCNCESPKKPISIHCVHGVRRLDYHRSLDCFVHSRVFFVLLCGSALSCGWRCRASNGGAACLSAVFGLKGFLTSQLRQKEETLTHTLSLTHTHTNQLFPPQGKNTHRFLPR